MNKMEKEKNCINAIQLCYKVISNLPCVCVCWILFLIFAWLAGLKIHQLYNKFNWFWNYLSWKIKKNDICLYSLSFGIPLTNVYVLVNTYYQILKGFFTKTVFLCKFFLCFCTALLHKINCLIFILITF